jgi:hypothetical protein
LNVNCLYQTFLRRWAYLLIHVVLRDAVALMAGGSFLSDNTTLSPSEKLAERQLRPHAFIVRRTPTSHVFFDTVRVYNLCLNALHPNIGAMNFQTHGQTASVSNGNCEQMTFVFHLNTVHPHGHTVEDWALSILGTSTPPTHFNWVDDPLRERKNPVDWLSTRS